MNKILKDKGKTPKIQADRKAIVEYKVFNKTQKIISYFDKEIKRINIMIINNLIDFYKKELTINGEIKKYYKLGFYLIPMITIILFSFLLYYIILFYQ